jgi:ATP-dependent Lon protease
MRIDSTYGKVNFCYLDSSQSSKSVMTLEEQEYPNYYYKSVDSKGDEHTILKFAPVIKPTLIEKNLTFQENQKGISFDLLFGDYLKEATKINISDAYIQSNHQIHNFMELLETIVKHKSEDVEIDVYLVTTENKQKETFEKIQESCCGVGIRFTWSFENNTSLKTIISTDNGWKIELDHGLDIFQSHDVDNAFTFSNRLQQYRSCKEFGISFVRIADDET